MRDKFRFVVILLVFLLGTLALARQILVSRDQDTSEKIALPILGGIPKFELIDQYSDSFSADNLKGKVTLTDFIFTTCPSVCPMMTQKKLKVFRRHQNNSKFQSLSITVNPAYDSPERLKTYAESTHSDKNGFSYRRRKEDPSVSLGVSLGRKQKAIIAHTILSAASNVYGVIIILMINML